MKVKYKTLESENWLKTELMTRSGKKGGKYDSEWNTRDGDGVWKVVDFERQVTQWEEITSHQTKPLKNTDQIESSSEDDSETETLFTDSYNYYTKEEELEAKIRELESWRENGVYTEVDDNDQYCVSFKWVVKPKVIEGLSSVKARLVLRGFEEEKNFRKDSPTCMRESVRLMLMIMSSKKWKLNSIDFKTAFLQGDPIERVVHVRPPKEANRPPGKIWRLNKTVYGLRDAPRMWYVKLKNTILDLGCKESSLDNGLFMKHDINGIMGLLCTFVDDILWCGSEKFYTEVVVKLKTILHVGSEQTTAFQYIGIKMSQESDYSIRISQERYIEDKLQPIQISIERSKQKNNTVTKGERKQLRSLMGKINWVSGISRPDIGFNTGLINTSRQATVKDILEVNKLVCHIKNTNTDILFPGLNLENLHLKVFTDASYGNLVDGGSQGGCIVFMTDGENACPLSWHSRRLQRVARNTLTAETLALVDGCESAFMLGKLVSEVMSGKFEESIPIVCVTDNKSLYDSAHSTSTLQDKRLQLEMCAIRQMIDQKEVELKWCPSEEQVSDVLTKKGASGVRLREVLYKGHF